ncbi:MAG: fatty acid hydroxylase family protein [Rhodanobacter sp.]|nr:MAG: fatty acid hydroxylase family protein [Rhodanobacter sp.]TAM01183.1 MAG: fatty acid hydroxylase family protein [Rhodanobacter sp.]TAM39674.1 MAG: fatty acid hydroxylase family protein [Rhodanobacter sp.]TAN25261.1 MAG: fatty acid hydroxylase family protein [Rhodanobacter sp.]
MKRSLVHSGLDAIARMSTTRTNYWAEFAVDAALCAVLLAAGWRHLDGSAWRAPLALVLGLFVFSFIEYLIHRWLFHTHIPLFEQGHRMHHEHPLGYDSLPFFLPPIVLLALAGLLVWLMPLGFALLLAGSITLGYITYGLSHFIIHHVRFKQPLLRRWAGAHHVHHYHPETNFGVTTLLWDIVFGTRYVRQMRKL